MAGQMPSMVLSGRIWRQEVTNIKTKKYISEFKRILKGKVWDCTITTVRFE